MLDVVIDGKSNRQMLSAIPTTLVVRFYSVEHAETVTLLAEKVLK
jgi:hypothetical protein